MSDLFHKDVHRLHQASVDAMKARALASISGFDKRSERVLELSNELEWSPQIWMA